MVRTASGCTAVECTAFIVVRIAYGCTDFECTADHCVLGQHLTPQPPKGGFLTQSQGFPYNTVSFNILFQYNQALYTLLAYPLHLF